MLYFAKHTKDSLVYVTSDKFSGEIDFSPYGFWGITKTNNNFDSVKFLGNLEETPGYKLQKFDNPFGPKRAWDEPKDEDLRIWPLHEQLSYFMPKDVYTNLFGPLNLKPKVMFIDIEVLNRKGESLDSKKHPICMIGIKFEDEIIIIDEPTEKETIIEFFKILKKKDPYIICGYFSKSFDIPYIISRMKINGLNFPEQINRMDLNSLPIKYLNASNGRRLLAFKNSVEKILKISDPSHQQLLDFSMSKDREARAKTENGVLPHELSFGFGRVHYDLYESVKLDARAINSIKNRRMKTVAEFYGSKDIFDLSDEEKVDMYTLYHNDREKMRTYLMSDMRQTSFLFDVYYPIYGSQAVMANTTFDYIVEGTGRAPFSKLFIGKIFSENNTYPYLKNEIRNIEIFQELTDEGKFRGAYTGIKKVGRFKTISKVDVNSMYPNLIITFNISPETVTYLGHKDIYPVQEEEVNTTIDKYVIKNGYYPILLEEIKENYLIVAIPDDKVNKYIRFRIDTSFTGAIPKKIDTLLKERKEVRKKMETIDKESSEYKILDSTQNNIKISANAVYGIMGNPHFDVGDISCAMLITAFGRELSHYMSTYLGESVIEIDTDGLYIDKTIDVDKLNQSITEVLTEKYKKFVIRQAMKLDLEMKDTVGIFLGMKNYVLKKEDGKIETKGSSLKGSSKAPYIEKILKEAARLLLEYQDISEVREKVNDLMFESKWKPEDFKMTLAISKEEGEYKFNGGFSTVLLNIYETLSISEPEMIFKRLDTLVEDELNLAVSIHGKSIFSTTKDKETSSTLFTPHIEFRNNCKKALKDYSKGTITKNKCSESLLYFAESCILLARPKKERSGMSVPLKLMKLAKAEGVLLMKGETLEFYHALGEEPLRIFTKENIKKYPINYIEYRRLVDNTLTTMLECVNEQESNTLF